MFLTWNSQQIVESNCAPYSKENFPLFPSCGFWHTSEKREGNYFQTPNLSVICSALCTELNALTCHHPLHLGTVPTVTPWYLLRPRSISAEQGGEKTPDPNFVWEGTKYFLHQQQEAWSTESIQDKFVNSSCKLRLLGCTKTSISRVSYHLISCLEEFSCVHVHSLV